MSNNRIWFLTVFLASTFFLNCNFSAMASSDEADSDCILILYTGGTIGGLADPDDPSTYIGGAINSGESIIKTVPVLANRLDPVKAKELGKLPIRVKDVFEEAIDSRDFDPEHWQLLANALQEAFDDDKVKGVIILHGTDSLELTLTLFHSMFNKRFFVPYLLTGAMRPADHEKPDGPRNIVGSLKALEELITEYKPANDELAKYYKDKDANAERARENKRIELTKEFSRLSLGKNKGSSLEVETDQGDRDDGDDGDDDDDGLQKLPETPILSGRDRVRSGRDRVPRTATPSFSVMDGKINYPVRTTKKGLKFYGNSNSGVAGTINSKSGASSPIVDLRVKLPRSGDRPPLPLFDYRFIAQMPNVAVVDVGVTFCPQVLIKVLRDAKIKGIVTMGHGDGTFSEKVYQCLADNQPKDGWFYKAPDKKPIVRCTSVPVHLQKDADDADGVPCLLGDRVYNCFSGRSLTPHKAAIVLSKILTIEENLPRGEKLSREQIQEYIDMHSQEPELKTTLSKPQINTSGY